MCQEATHRWRTSFRMVFGLVCEQSRTRCTWELPGELYLQEQFEEGQKVRGGTLRRFWLCEGHHGIQYLRDKQHQKLEKPGQQRKEPTMQDLSLRQATQIPQVQTFATFPSERRICWRQVSTLKVAEGVEQSDWVSHRSLTFRAAFAISNTGRSSSQSLSNSSASTTSNLRNPARTGGS